MSQKLIALSAAVFLWAGTWFYHPVDASSCRFIAIDVGQGDAILIQTPDHQDILIDGGPSTAVVEKLGKFLVPGNRDIELMVLTHPHADHVNGLVAVTEQFTVRAVLLTNVRYRQIAYEAWIDQLEKQKTIRHIAVSGRRFMIGQAALDILWPGRDLSDGVIEHDDASHGGGVNDSSIVMRLTCGGSVAMLMGDASSEIEERILESGVDVKASLLKIGHHGSRFSSSPIFLDAVKPKTAVVSSGAGNRYAHPHPTTLLRLRRGAVEILRTDRAGDIIMASDGRGGWQRKFR